MKIQLSCLLQALILAIPAAAADPEGSTAAYEQAKQCPDPELAAFPPEARPLSTEVRREVLGVGPDDFVMAITEKGPIIYCTEKGCPKDPGLHGPGSRFPAGKKVFQFIEILETRSSPSCYWYRDGNGHTRWVPSPPCPL